MVRLCLDTFLENVVTNNKNKIMEERFEHGKIPPQAIDLEVSVLGAILILSDAIAITADILKPKDFYKDAHQRVFKAAITLFEKSEPVDLMTVTNQLRSTGELELVGGAYFITEMTLKTGGSHNVEYWSRIILEHSIKRQIISISAEATKNAYDDTEDVFEILKSATSNILELADTGSRGKFESAGDIAKKRQEEVHNIRSGKIKDNTIPSHIPSYNKIITGFSAPDVIILAARPSMGKTALMLSFAIETAALSYPVGIFSLEMSKVQLINRAYSIAAGLPHHVIKNPQLMNESQLYEFDIAAKRIDELPMYIDDTPAINIIELRAKARRMKYDHGVKMIYVDYLQLMSGVDDKGNRESEIASISRGIKEIAKDLDIPIMALSQLNRSVESRPDKRPQLSDLRESGAIEQDADQVIFLFRPDYYKITDVDGFTQEEVSELGEGNVAKHRNGELGVFYMHFNKNMMYYSDFYARGSSNAIDKEIKTSTDLRAGMPNMSMDVEIEDTPL